MEIDIAEIILIFLFILSVLMIFYIYCGYPFIAFLISKISNKKIDKSEYEPSVTILIAAYNEEECIGDTIQNKLNLNYPGEKFEVIVISDGSSDKTEEIVKQYVSKSVRLLRQEPRSGKTMAINMAVPEAKGEILVFADANSIYAPDALARLVQNFNDPKVGYVTGKMIYTNPDGSSIGDGCTAYMKYENLLRRIETRLGSIVGVDGGIDAVRKELYTPMNPDQLPDFVLPLRVFEQGYRIIYEPEALLQESALKETKDEYQMRVRVSLRALWALMDMRKLLSFKKHGIFAWQLWSHKVIRYLCFICLIIAYFANVALWPENVLYKISFVLQNMAYLGAIASPFLGKIGWHSRLLYLLNYFVLLNLASAHAFFKFILRQKQVIWKPRKG